MERKCIGGERFSGEGQVVLLSGEPGIGKSRVTQVLLERIATEPHVRLRYFCSRYHVNSALYPVIDQLERAARLKRDDPAEAQLDKLEATLKQGTRTIHESAALLAPLLSIPSGERYPQLSLNPQQQKSMTFEVLLDQLVSLTKRQPVLQILEDAHWSDPTTIELFDLTVDRIQSLPCCSLLPYPAVVGHRTLGVTLFFLGEFVEARLRLQSALALYDEQRHASLALRYGQDPGVAQSVFSSLAPWQLGYQDQALRTCEDAIARARELDHSNPLACAL